MFEPLRCHWYVGVPEHPVTDATNVGRSVAVEQIVMLVPPFCTVALTAMLLTVTVVETFEGVIVHPPAVMDTTEYVVVTVGDTLTVYVEPLMLLTVNCCGDPLVGVAE
jgi:hypothetical protein